jgi:hypothetical protein
MHISELNTQLWLASDIGKALLLGIMIQRQLYRTFPVFFTYVSWDLLSDLLLFVILSASPGYLGHHYPQFYYSAGMVTYVLEFGVLLEIASNVLQPAKRMLSQGFRYFLFGAVLVLGIVCFWLAVWVNPTPFTNLRVFLVMDTTAAILCVLMFLLIAGFSQVLGLSWKNHVLQLTTGLALYSVVELTVELIQSQLHAGSAYASQYQFWSQFKVVGYLCTLSFWCYAFLKKEAPRKEFSPQMQKVLVYLSGSTKRQRAVVARSRDD